MQNQTALRLRQTAAWCKHIFSNGFALRSPQLRPALLSSEDPSDQLWSILDHQDLLPVAVTEICHLRQKLIEKTGLNLPTIAECKMNGRILCTDFDTDSCAAATEPSQGFFNDCDIPGWDSWFAYEKTVGLGRIYGWIPNEMYDAVNIGMEVIPVQSVWWIDEIPQSAT